MLSFAENVKVVLRLYLYLQTHNWLRKQAPTVLFRKCLTNDPHQSKSWLNILLKLGFIKGSQHCSCICVMVNMTTPWPSSVAEVSYKPWSLFCQRLHLQKAHLTNHSDALVHGVSVRLLAFPGCGFQSRHKRCSQENRRPEKPFWILCGLPTATHPCQKEPVSTKHPRFSLNIAMCKPNIRTRSMLLVLFTSATLQQHLSAASPLSLIIKVCLHAGVTRYFCL